MNVFLNDNTISNNFLWRFIYLNIEIKRKKIKFKMLKKIPDYMNIDNSIKINKFYSEESKPVRNLA